MLIERAARPVPVPSPHGGDDRAVLADHLPHAARARAGSDAGIGRSGPSPAAPPARCRDGRKERRSPRGKPRPPRGNRRGHRARRARPAARSAGRARPARLDRSAPSQDRARRVSSALRITTASGRPATGMRPTKVPDWGKMSTSRSSESRISASRTGVRLTPKRSVNSFSERGAPGRSRMSRIAWRNWLRIRVAAVGRTARGSGAKSGLPPPRPPDAMLMRTLSPARPARLKACLTY